MKIFKKIKYYLLVIIKMDNMDKLHIAIVVLLLYLVLKPCNCKLKEGFHGRRDYYGRYDNALYSEGRIGL
jgi:hypothetical protein